MFFSPWIYFCVWCNLVSSFIFLHIAVQISQHHSLNFMLLPPLSNINRDHRDGFISALSILFYCSMCLFLCQYQTVLIIVVLNTVWYQVWWSLLLCSFSKLLRLFGVIYGSVQSFEMFVLYLWNMSLVF